MKVSVLWLQKYFSDPLPDMATLVDALTFHSFEVESSDERYGGVIDVNVLPNRAADCLSHRGIAKELSAILKMPLKEDPLRITPESFLETKVLKVSVDSEFVNRHIGAVVRGVTVGESPKWLKDALASVGQKSINNIVDATNYVMLDIGQPLHAFDFGKIQKDGVASISIRSAKAGEEIALLSGDTIQLGDDIHVIADEISGMPLDIAGIKGGLHSGVGENTKDLFISVGNYNGTIIRKTCQRLKILTDASTRYQNHPSPVLTSYGMSAILKLIPLLAGGEIEGVIDVYPVQKAPSEPVQVTVDQINTILGSTFNAHDIEDALLRLDIPFESKENTYIVSAPFERPDLTISEDIAEEVGRIIGLDKVLPKELKQISVIDQARFKGIEKVKDFLVERGFTEVSTQSFAKKGDVWLLNPLDKTKPALRTTLAENLTDAFVKAKLYAPITVAPNVKPKVFEVGTVFSKEGERIAVQTSEPVPDIPEIAPDAEYVPKRYALSLYKSFSLYPFIVRDVAFWAPDTTDVGPTRSHIKESAGPMLVRCTLFDTFSKEGRTSFAFRLVFQSHERTLTDEEVQGFMASVTEALTKKGWEVR
ncbi:phenylalanine--tRNA ligase subunit beta [Patescibacteria group bacterium]|nr:MAG: phenylalanine--tRNA ligase subunit beta [Patescibacteria group bacterium]